ncbi:MAG: sugar translocase [Firmicutes bacterium HGW-Firmicutes-21]|nr:MAG: sugar translocase [Firmicutes bacterium HGW-Firmicutes-21]
MKNIIIIPAYNPDNKLTELIDSLIELPDISDIVVVDDGSNEESASVFSAIQKNVTLLSHNENHGKGSAIKTVLNYVLQNTVGIHAVACVDADGQHSAKDAERLLNYVGKYPDSLILGVRTFSEHIPWKSRWGNKITRLVFRLLSGVSVSDTQTGLRAFSTNLIPFLLDVNGERYEYEMNMLASCTRKRIAIKEVAIQTIYNDEKNTCSHFRPFKDSLRIYGNLILFAGSSFLCFLLDYVVFIPMVWVFGVFSTPALALTLGNISARLVSSSFNYYLNSNFVFINDHRRKTMSRYFLLVGCILVLNTVVLHCLTRFFGLNHALAKIITETLLFIVSFSVQKLIIFRAGFAKEGIDNAAKE